MRMLGPSRPEDRHSDLTAWAHVFDLWGRATRRTWLTTYQLGYLQPRRTVWRRPRPPLPILQLLVRADELIDLSDPRTGFSGPGRAPAAADGVLTLWADDLLTVHHGTDWIYVVDADTPLARSWLELVVPPRGTLPPPFAVVAASTEPTPAGEFRVTDLDATTPTCAVRIVDRRRDRVVGLPADIRTARAGQEPTPQRYSR